jgi:hypothetical protein
MHATAVFRFGGVPVGSDGSIQPLHYCHYLAMEAAHVYAYSRLHSAIGMGGVNECL